eukprot:COSAG05_NODE_2566_length_2889_cov_2.640143_3_plen_68_part_00
MTVTTLLLVNVGVPGDLDLSPGQRRIAIFKLRKELLRLRAAIQCGTAARLGHSTCCRIVAPQHTTSR